MCGRTERSKRENLTFGVNVTSLSIYLDSINFLKFDKINKLCITCGHFTNNDLSLFSRIDHLELISSLNITDISSIKNVPILGFCDCCSIKNFSCLGSQQVLYISSCMIDEKDVEGLSRIPNLIISSCATLKAVTHLHSSNYMSISCCSNLTKITLLGSQYLNVKIDWCRGLTTVDITGRVYFFSMLNCKSLISDIESHCEYFEKHD
jgi:hypothetical protein